MIISKKYNKIYLENDNENNKQSINDFNINLSSNFNSDNILANDNNEINVVKRFEDIKNSNLNYIIIKLHGGIGNQLFQLCFAIGQKHKNHKLLILDQVNNFRNENIINNNKIKINIDIIKDFKDDYNEFNQIDEKNNYINHSCVYHCNFHMKKCINYKNYLINGYYQSYLYFWNEFEIIKKYIKISDFILNKTIQTYMKLKENKKLLGIHIRLTDYLKSSDFYHILSKKYFKNCLDQLNLSEYNVILFSDDYDYASIFIKEIINEKILIAKNYSEDTIEELLLLSFTDVRICSNSTFSLWSCYLNEIFKFNQNSKYYFSNKWYNDITGYKYDLFNLIPFENYNFIIEEDNDKIINNKNKEYIFIIYSCKKYNEKSIKLYDKLYNKLNNCKIYILNGGNNKNEIKDNFILLNVNDDYENLNKKTLEMIKFVNKTFPEIDGLFKCDDDIIPNIKYLNDFINNPKLKYINYCGKVYNSDFNSVSCGGPLYYLSNFSLKMLNEKCIINSDCEDAMIGKNLFDLKISLNHIDLYSDDINDLNKTSIHNNKDKFNSYLSNIN